MLNKSKNKQPKKTKQPGNNLAGPEKHVVGWSMGFDLG